MGKRYQVWNRTDDIYTPSGHMFTPEQWLDLYQWAKNPKARMIISAGTINGGICMEFDQMVAHYRDRGANIPDSILNDDEAVIAAIEACEDAEQLAAMEASQIPSAEERIASALELQTLMME